MNNIKSQLERAYAEGWQRAQISNTTMAEERARYFARVNPLSETDGSKPYFCVVENPADNLSIRASWHEGETPRVEIIAGGQLWMTVYPEPWQDTPVTQDNVMQLAEVKIMLHHTGMKALALINKLTNEL
jgi:hypothetical protein